MQFNAAALRRNDVGRSLGRGTDGRSAAADPAAADAAAVVRAVVRRLRRLRRRQPRTDVDVGGVGRRRVGRVAHRRARRSSVHGGGDNVERLGAGPDRQQSHLHGPRRVVHHFDERLARLAQRTD